MDQTENIAAASNAEHAIVARQEQRRVQEQESKKHANGKRNSELAKKAASLLMGLELAMSRIDKQIAQNPSHEALRKLHQQYGAIAMRAKEISHLVNNPQALTESHHLEEEHHDTEHHDDGLHHVHGQEALHEELHELLKNAHTLYNQEYKYQDPTGRATMLAPGSSFSAQTATR